MVLTGPADNIPVDAPTFEGERSYQVRPILERHEPRPTLQREDTGFTGQI